MPGTALLSRRRGKPALPTSKPDRLPWHSILRALEARFRTGRWRVPVLRVRGSNPFLILVSTILSQRTRDEVTKRVTQRLLSVYPDARGLACASIDDIEGLIREVGLWKAKARGLRRAARVLVAKYHGELPPTVAELSHIPMVGPKTAHAILVFGHKRPGIPVDTHILRVTRRMGVVVGSTISEAQQELASKVPKRYWQLLNPVLVQHGMNICTASSPRCGICPIAMWCLRIGVATPGSHRLAHSGKFSSRPRARGQLPTPFERT